MTLPHPDDITSIVQIQALVVEGFRDWQRYGDVSVHAWEDLLILNYTTRAIYEARWNFFECVSRGLIIHTQSGEIVARGFDKFWNWLQGGRQASEGGTLLRLPIRSMAHWVCSIAIADSIALPHAAAL